MGAGEEIFRVARTGSEVPIGLTETNRVSLAVVKNVAEAETEVAGSVSATTDYFDTFDCTDATVPVTDTPADSGFGITDTPPTDPPPDPGCGGCGGGCATDDDPTL